MILAASIKLIKRLYIQSIKDCVFFGLSLTIILINLKSWKLIIDNIATFFQHKRVNILVGVLVSICLAFFNISVSFKASQHIVIFHRAQRNMAPKYILHYYKVPARGELIRILFNLAGVEFEEKNFVLTKDIPVVKAKGMNIKLVAMCKHL